MVRTAFARVPSVAGRVALVAASLFVAATADSYQLASDGSSYSVSGLATGTCRSYLLNIRPYSKSATIRVSPSSGDPDLYVSSQPLTCATKSSATWSSRSGAGSYDTVSLTSTQLASLDQLYVVVYAYTSTSFTVSFTAPLSSAVPSATPWGPTPTRSPASGAPSSEMVASGTSTSASIVTNVPVVRFFTLPLASGLSDVSVSMSVGTVALEFGTAGLPSCATCPFDSSSDDMTVVRTASGARLNLASSETVYVRAYLMPDTTARSVSYTFSVGAAVGSITPATRTPYSTVTSSAAPATPSALPSGFAPPTQLYEGSTVQNSVVNGQPHYFTITQGAALSVRVTLRTLSGDTDIQLGVSGLPSCTTCSFTQITSSTSGGTSTDVVVANKVGYERTLYLRVYAYSSASTYSISYETTSGTFSTSSSGSSSSSSSRSSVNAGAIVGAVVGGVFGFVILMVVMALVIASTATRRRRQAAAASTITVSTGSGPAGNGGGATRHARNRAAGPSITVLSPPPAPAPVAMVSMPAQPPVMSPPLVQQSSANNFYPPPMVGAEVSPWANAAAMPTMYSSPYGGYAASPLPPPPPPSTSFTVYPPPASTVTILPGNGGYPMMPQPGANVPYPQVYVPSAPSTTSPNYAL